MQHSSDFHCIEFYCSQGKSVRCWERKTRGANLEQQFADLVFALGGGFVERCELPQVGHVDRGAVSDQQLGHLVVTVRTGVMEGNQASVKRKQHIIIILLPSINFF